MEETKELQTMYKIFRCLIYLSLIVEFFEYALNIHYNTRIRFHGGNKRITDHV